MVLYWPFGVKLTCQWRGFVNLGVEHTFCQTGPSAGGPASHAADLGDALVSPSPLLHGAAKWGVGALEVKPQVSRKQRKPPSCSRKGRKIQTGPGGVDEKCIKCKQIGQDDHPLWLAAQRHGMLDALTWPPWICCQTPGTVLNAYVTKGETKQNRCDS